MIKLQRVDYLQVASLKGEAIHLLSAKGDKNQQKIVVGDQRGVLQLVSIRMRGGTSGGTSSDGPFVLDFKVHLDAPINCICCSALLTSSLDIGSGMMTEMIVVATAQTIRSFSVKGKSIFTLETNLVEPIQHLWMSSSREDVIAANSYVYNHYHDGKEANYFLSTDRINALAVLPPNKVPSLTPVLACQDGTVYSLRDSSVRHRLPLESIPTALRLLGNDGGASGECLVYGTDSGQLGLVRCSRAGPSLQWALQSSSSPTSSRASVTSLHFYDLKGTGVDQLIVGRDDGQVQVYEFSGSAEDGDGDVNPPALIYSQNFSDSIAAVRGGVVGAAGYPEILVATQQGWIFGLTTSESLARLSRAKAGDPVTAARLNAHHQQGSERRNQLQQLMMEVEKLEKKVADAQHHQAAYSKSMATMSRSPGQQSSVIAKMNYVADERLYYISVESQLPINYCLVQCDAEVQLSDVERNLAILNVIKPDESGQEGQLLATFRCQANTTRLEMKLRSSERPTSDLVRLHVVLVNMEPQPVSAELPGGCVVNNAAVLRTFRLTCLRHHVRCQPFEWEGRPYDRLTFGGGFSLADAHNWIASCLPNVPDKIPAVEGEGPDDAISFYFLNRQWETALSVHYRRGQMVFLSDNPVALSHVREFVSREATSVKNIQLSITAGSGGRNKEEDAVTAGELVRRIHPRLTEMICRKDRSILCAALKEAATDQLAQDSSSSDWMTEEFRTILQTTPGTTSASGEDEDDPCSLQELQSFLLALYSASRGEILGESLHQTRRGAPGSRQQAEENDDLASLITSTSTEALVDMFRPQHHNRRESSTAF